MGGNLQGGRRYLGGEILKGEFLKVSHDDRSHQRSHQRLYENSPYQCPSCAPRTRKRTRQDEGSDEEVVSDDDDDDQQARPKTPKTFDEIPALTRERALHRLLAVLGQEQFPPADDAGAVELARRWEADIDNDQHPIAEVRQWKLFRVKHLYDASTTQRLVKDPETRRWIEAKRGEMDTM